MLHILCDNLSKCEKSAKVANSSLADTSPRYRIPNLNFGNN